MLKRYLLGGDVQHTAGDGLGITVAPPVRRTVSAESGSKHAPSVSQESIERDTSEAAFQKSLQRRCDPQSGIRAPRSSRQDSILTFPKLPRSPSPLVASAALPRVEIPAETQEEKQKPKQEVSWQDLEIPEELGVVDEGIPAEIRNIVHDTMEMHRAMRISRMQSKADEEAASDTLGNNPGPDASVNAESSTMGSARSSESTPTSDYMRRKSDGFSISQESVTTAGSEVGDGAYLQAPKATSGRPGSPKRASKSKQDQADTLSPMSAMTKMEIKFNESKDRMSRSMGLYNLFKGRRIRPIPAPKAPTPEPPPCECTSCFDDVPHKNAVDGLPCRHRYCRACFTQLVNTAILSEDTFPPKCCLTEIPNPVMRKYLDPAELTKFDEKSLEYAVPLASRYYCAEPRCARWIDTRIAKRTDGALECPHCQNKLCTVCRGPQHPGNEDCPQDYGLDATLEQAELAGWRRCYSCRAMVELNTGCRHITCKCRAEFWYVPIWKYFEKSAVNINSYTCGAVWRTCQCTEADQRRRERELEYARGRREIDAAAEREEVRRAIAAVEEAERHLREEREAEEAREQARLQQEAEELTQREFERVERIGERFAELRAILDHVGLQQKQAIEKRHVAQEEANDSLAGNFEKVVAQREQEINADKKAKAAENDKAVKALQKKHAAAIMETIQRHRRDQDDLLAKPLPEDSTAEDPETIKAELLEALMPLQELERKTLKAQQAREIGKWKSRGARALNSKHWNVKIQQMRFEEEEKMAAAIDSFNKQQEADLQWFDVIHGDRATMLAEDETRLVVGGGDVLVGAQDGESTPTQNGQGCATISEDCSPRDSRGSSAVTPPGISEDDDIYHDAVPERLDEGSELFRHRKRNVPGHVVLSGPLKVQC